MGMAPERPHVVVVDDAEELRTLFAAILGEAGCRCTILAAAPSVAELVRIEPDALVLDLLLGQDEDASWNLVEAMRTGPHPRLRSIPVIVCSAATPLLLRLDDHFAEMGVVPVSKPFDLDDFLATLADLLRTDSSP